MILVLSRTHNSSKVALLCGFQRLSVAVRSFARQWTAMHAEKIFSKKFLERFQAALFFENSRIVLDF